MPWKLMENPAVLYGILNNIGAMLGPATGIIIADFFLVRKQILDVPELFKANGRYQYSKGFSPIGLGLLVVISAVLISGQFISSMGWLYEYAWPVGLVIGFAAYLVCIAILKSTRGGELPEYYQPIGEFGEELAEIQAK
jgi:NCS1 family nucleobase:cation symporter-1